MDILSALSAAKKYYFKAAAKYSADEYSASRTVDASSDNSSDLLASIHAAKALTTSAACLAVFAA